MQQSPNHSTQVFLFLNSTVRVQPNCPPAMHSIDSDQQQ